MRALLIALIIAHHGGAAHHLPAHRFPVPPKPCQVNCLLYHGGVR